MLCIMRCLACHAHEVFAMAFEWLLKHSQKLVERVAQDGDTFNEIGAAFKVKGDFKDAWSSAFRLRDSL